MRLVSEIPQNEIELKIEEILVESGVDQKEIQFRDKFRDTDRYLRVGYWERVQPNILANLTKLGVLEDAIYDDDCGWLFMYQLN